MKQTEPTRTREKGTRVFKTSCGQDKIDALRKIVEEKQYAKIDGVMVDGYSASAILSVYDNIKKENQIKYASCHISKMANIAFKLLSDDLETGAH